MKRKVTLYIGGIEADLDDQALILFNYAAEDLSNPTIVKNSYSQKVTLRGTETNNYIFGNIFRVDRTIVLGGGVVGPGFNPAQKVPFSIYNELNDVIESGYVKLESIENKNGQIAYTITLFGGLGSFFYALSYNENGDKRTLADLDYIGGGESELNFYITKETVREAWDYDPDEEGQDPKWGVINFAPAYNGIPENFSADKGIVNPSSIGLPATVDGHTTKNGYALVNFANAVDEYAAKDFRSYLQRPIFSMKAFWEAICNPANNGGYTVDASAVENMPFPKMWLTRPLLPSLGTYKSIESTAEWSLTSSLTSNVNVGQIDIVDTLPAGSKISLAVKTHLLLRMPASTGTYVLSSEPIWTVGPEHMYGRTAFFVQLVAYDSVGNAVGGSSVKVIHGGGNYTQYCSNEQFAEAMGYTPAYALEDGQYEAANYPEEQLIKESLEDYIYPNLSFSVNATGAASFKFFIRRIVYVDYIWNNNHLFMPSTSDVSSAPVMWRGDDAYNGLIRVGGSNTAETTVAISYTTPSTLRSGALVSKKMLLSTEHTPAEYMISFCKIFGLHFLYDPAQKKVTIVTRNGLFKDENVDLTKLIDRKSVTIKPFVFDSKWYNFGLESAGGAYSDSYKMAFGRGYGDQRVNTGYSFASEVKELLSDNAFKKAVTILARSKYFVYITEGGYFKPSPFIDTGNTYTLWNAAGESLDTAISCPSNSAVVHYFGEDGNDPVVSENMQGFDVNFARKMEFRGADGKPLDGADVLVFSEGWNQYRGFNLTDDLAVMDTINDGVPCWILTPGDATESGGMKIPIYQQYSWRSGNFHVDDALDFGLPAELDIPNAYYEPTRTLYSRLWKNYLTDRYDMNTKVMTCKVDLSGMQVGQDLLRKFYWYDGAWWVLNRITNYSMTTYDLAECEFVQVQNKQNYLNGQFYGNN